MFSRITTLTLIDQLIKFITLALYRKKVILINGFLSIELIKNQGISFGFLANISKDKFIYLTVAKAIILVLLFIYYKIHVRRISRAKRIAMELIISGGAGNLLDRVFYGAVVDMINLSFFGIHIFTFNIADLYITFGVLLYLLYRNRKIHHTLQKDKYSKYKLKKEDNI